MIDGNASFVLNTITQEKTQIVPSVEMWGLARMRKASDPRKELQDLKKTMGGFKPAYKLMTEDLYDNCRLLSIVTKPLWDWYTKQLKETKHPRDALQYSIQMAQNWNKDEHIRQMADLLTSVPTFAWCSTRGTLNVAKKVVNLVYHLMSLRLWSSSRYSHPPDSYSLLLSDDPEVKYECGAVMECEHTWRLLEFERDLASQSAPHPHVKMLHRDFCLILNHPTRLLMDAFEIGQYNTNFEKTMETTKHLITILCQTLPDNKIIEDIHGYIRKEAKSNNSEKLTCENIQSIVRNCTVLEQRRIDHPSSIAESTFLKEWATTKLADKDAQSNAMHKHWHHIMGKKTWNTLSEETLERGAAAWQWFVHYGDKLQQCTDVSLQEGYLSKFGIPHEVFRYNSDATEHEKQQKWLCMGQNTWATLMWPLREMTFEDFSGVYYFLVPTGTAEWKFLYKPSSWMVIPTEVVELEGRFGFHQTGSEMPLPCFYLRSASFFGVLRRTFYFNQFQFATLALSNHFFV